MNVNDLKISMGVPYVYVQSNIDKSGENQDKKQLNTTKENILPDYDEAQAIAAQVMYSLPDNLVKKEPDFEITEDASYQRKEKNENPDKKFGVVGKTVEKQINEYKKQESESIEKIEKDGKIIIRDKT